MNYVQVNLHQFLGSTELQQHVCDSVEDLQQHIGTREQINNTVLPHRGSRTEGLMSDSYGRSPKPPIDHSSSHHQNIDKSVKNGGLQYSQSVTQQPSIGQRNHGRIVKYSQTKQHHSGVRQDDWRQMYDSHSPQALRQQTAQQQNFYDTVSTSF